MVTHEIQVNLLLTGKSWLILKLHGLLLGTLCASLLGNALSGKGVIQAGERAGKCLLIFYVVLKYKDIKRNLNLIACFQEITYLK